VLHWFENYHIDGLRCDAIHAVYDNGAVHFWELVHTKINSLRESTGKSFHLIAESDLNSPKVIQSPENGGFGFDAQWLDDFHHALYVLVNPADKERYYDFGTMEQLAKAYKEGFVHSGEWVQFRKRKHGRSSAGVAGNQFIAFNLNHDQAGNRAGGERLCMLVNFERVKLAAAALLLSPYVPMLFMGEEYADNTPFFYFVSHSDADLIKAVQEGRKAEFKDFGFDGEIPDPQDEETFNRSKIGWEDRTSEKHQIILKWHKALIALRKTEAALKNFDKKSVEVAVINDQAFVLLRRSAGENETLVCFFNLSENEMLYTIPFPLNKATKILDSAAAGWQWKQEQKNEHPERIGEGDGITVLPLSMVVYKSQ
jgi:maltooligosyltrehalose trehalohydrolase